MRQDSIRLRTGGTAPVQKVSEKSTQSNELLTTRFRRADSTLSRADIRELYFSVDGREDTAPFLSKIEAEADRLIEGKNFTEDRPTRAVAYPHAYWAHQARLRPLASPQELTIQYLHVPARRASQHDRPHG